LESGGAAPPTIAIGKVIMPTKKPAAPQPKVKNLPARKSPAGGKKNVTTIKYTPIKL
jgi:hypothetical protein